MRATCTILRESQQRNRRKPHQQERYAPPTFLLCFLKSVCSRFTYANTRGKSAGFRRGVMLQPLSGRLQAGFGLLPPPLPAVVSASLASRFPKRPCSRVGRTWGDDGLTTFRACSRTVWFRSRLFAGGLSSAPGQFGNPRTGPRTFWSKRCQQLSLVLCDDVYRRFT